MVIKIEDRWYRSEEKAKSIQICSYCDVSNHCKPCNQIHRLCNNSIGEDEVFKLISENEILDAMYEYEKKDLTV